MNVLFHGLNFVIQVIVVVVLAFAQLLGAAYIGLVLKHPGGRQFLLAFHLFKERILVKEVNVLIL